MKNKIKAQLLEQLNQALHNIDAAIKRHPTGNSVEKINMLEAKSSLQNSIELVKVCCDEE